MDKGCFKAKGADIYYEVDGKGANLLFIHAGIADRRMWDREFGSLSKYYRTIRIDLPGYGLSNFTGGDYSYNHILNDLLKYLNVDKTYIIAASFGGKIAIEFVLANQDKCSGMVLMAPAVSGWVDSEYLLAFYEEEDKLFEANEFEEVAVLNFNNWILRDRLDSDINQDIRDLVIDMQMQSLEKEEIQNKEIEEENSIFNLKTIKVPVLIVIGNKDVENFQEIAELIHKEIEASQKIVMENAAHLANLEYPELFETILLNFFSGL